MQTYILDHKWEQERRRLDLLEALHDASTIRRLERTGVSPGHRCLEVGAGRGSIATWLSRRVEPGGSVLALDLDVSLLDDCAAPNLEIRAGDVLDVDLEPESFDVIHARAVLTHIPERSRALERMASWLAPGGWLVLEEIDSLSDMRSDPVWSTVVRGFERATATVDWHCGRELVPELTALGLRDVGADADVDVLLPGSPAAEWVRLSLRAMQPAVRAAETLTDEDVEAGLARLHDPAFGALGLLWIGAWGRRGVTPTLRLED